MNKIKVGDLVRANHWGSGYLGLVVSVRLKVVSVAPNTYSGICRVMINGGHCVDQLMRDLEVINESR